MSRCWPSLSPPQSRTTTVAPRRIKYRPADSAGTTITLGRSPAHKVRAIAWPIVNTHFGYAVAYGLDITKVAHGNVTQARLDASDSATIPQTFNPPRESGAFNDIEHGNIVNRSWQFVKDFECLAIAWATGTRLDSLPMKPRRRPGSDVGAGLLVALPAIHGNWLGANIHSPLLRYRKSTFRLTTGL